MNLKYCRAGVGLPMGRAQAQRVLGLVPTHWWVRLVPRLEPAGLWVRPGPRVFWSWCLPTIEWIWVSGFLAARLWGSWVYCLHTGV